MGGLNETDGGADWVVDGDAPDWVKDKDGVWYEIDREMGVDAVGVAENEGDWL